MSHLVRIWRLSVSIAAAVHESSAFGTGRGGTHPSLRVAHVNAVCALCVRGSVGRAQKIVTRVQSLFPRSQREFTHHDQVRHVGRAVSLGTEGKKSEIRSLEIV
jgi:hypothetical protein